MEISIVKLKNVVGSIINWVRQDLIDNVLTPEKSWLYLEFNDINLDDTNFYTELKSIIENGDQDQRKLEVRLMFDKDRANLPTIHIHYPTEDGKSGDNSLNTGWNGIEATSDGIVDKFSRSFIGQYELIVTGGNSLEVVMIYEFLDALLVAAADTLSYNFDKFEFSGKQLLANQDIIPFLTYYRAIGMSLQNKKIVRAITNKRQLATSIQFEGTLVSDSQEPVLEDTVTVVLSPLESTYFVGDSIEVEANVINGGFDPQYAWYVLGNPEGTNSNTFQITFAATGTVVIECKVLSSIQYLLPRPAWSNAITITVLPAPIP